MGLLFPFIYIITYTLSLSFFFDKSLVKLLPFGVLTSIFIVYFFSLITTITNAYYISIVIVILVLLYFVLIKKVNIKDKILSKSMIVIILLYAFVTILNFKRGFGGWDDYSHWGIMVKEMFRLNRLYCVNESVLTIHKDYPPLVSLFEFVWCKLSGGYSEAYCMRAVQFLSLSFGVYAIKEDDKIINKVVVCMLFLLVSITYEGLANLMYNTIYVDALVGILIGFSLYLSLTLDLSEKDNVFMLVMVYSFMLLVKQINIVFFALSLFGAFINMVFVNKKKSYLNFSLITLIPFILSKTWDLYYKQFDVVSQFVISDIDFLGFFNVLKNGSELAYQQTSGINFLNAIFNDKFFNGYSYVYSVYIIIFILIMLAFASKQKNKRFVLTYLLGAVGYGFVMLLLYMYSFGPTEGPMLASFSRYLSTYLYAGLFLIFYLIMNLEVTYKLAYGFFISITMSITNFAYLKPSFVYHSLSDSYTKHGIVERINNLEEPINGLYVLAQYDNGFMSTMMRYHLNPISISGGSIGEAKYEGDFWSENISLDDFKQMILQSGYLYIYQLDDYAYVNYLYPALKIDYFKEGELYKIDGSIDDIKATLIN